MIDKITNKLTVTLSLTLFFALATVGVIGGLGPLAAIRDQAWIPGFFSLIFLLLSFYYLADLENRQNILLMLAALLICLAVPLIVGVVMVVTL